MSLQNYPSPRRVRYKARVAAQTLARKAKEEKTACETAFAEAVRRQQEQIQAKKRKKTTHGVNLVG